MQRICTTLREMGFDVELIGRVLPHSKALKTKPFKQRRFKLWFNKSFLFYAEYNIRLFFYLLFNKSDIICSIDLDSLLPGYLASRIKNSILIHDAHELFTEMPELDENSIAKKTWTAIEDFVFPKLKYAYTESKGYQEIYHQKFPKTAFDVIRNVPFYYQSKRQVDDGAFILYQGAVNVGRGLEQAIKAMKNIDYRLKIAGDGPLLNDLKALAEKEGVAHKVEFLGMLQIDELQQVTRQAKIGLNLLDPSNRHYQLSFPNKLFDYIMAELPQISMNFPYYQEVTESKNIGVLIDDLNATTVEKAINKLLTDQVYYSDAIANCRQLKEVHNWDKEKQKVINFYSDFLCS